MVKLKRKDEQIILTLQPNRSANWQQNKRYVALISLIVLLIALGWAAAGVWIMLPFAGLEVGLLSYLMYRVSLSTYQKQIITIDSTTVLFQAGTYQPVQVYCFYKDNLAVKTSLQKTEFEHTNICFDDGKHCISIGQFLNQFDRITMLEYLRKANLYVHSEQWWKSEHSIKHKTSVNR